MADDKRNRDIDTVARDCIALRVRMLNRIVTSIYDEALRPLGLKASQFNVLVAAAKLGLARPQKVCEILQMDVSTLSRNAERLRAKGWLEAVPGEDGRVQSLRLTARGSRLLEQAIPAWEEAQRRTRDLLGHDGATLLAKTTERVVRQPVS
jgi:DNA-binding MarR family transcriptional regulator